MKGQFKKGKSDNLWYLIMFGDTDVLTEFANIWKSTPSRQILVPRTSRGRLPPTSPGRSLKILFDRTGDVSIWRPGDVPIWLPGNVLKWRPGDVLIWCSRDVPGRLIRDVPRTFSGHPLEDLQSTQTWISQIFFNFSFRTDSIDQIYLKAFQCSRCIENPMKLLRWSIFCKISYWIFSR